MSEWGGRAARVLRRLTAETYGTTCHICGEPIDLAVAGPDPRAFTADHLVPRSRGGSDDLANLRPAHLGCNSSRGTTPLTATRKPVDNRRFFELGATGQPAPPPEVPSRTPRKKPDKAR